MLQLPPLHPMIVHFPIALFVIAVLFDGITTFTKKSTLIQATRLLMVFSALGTIAAITTGEMLSSHRGRFLPQSLLHTHQALAIAFGVYAIFLCALRLRRTWQPTGRYMSLAVVGVLLLAAVGHTGGSMAWPSVPAVASAQTKAPPTVHGSGHTHKTTVVKAGSNGSNGSTKSHSGSNSSKKVAVSSGGQAPKKVVHHQTSASSRGQTVSTKRQTASSSEVVIQPGDNSQAVASLQTALAAAHVFNHTITTYYGPVTEAAVKSFQAQEGLAVTGEVDSETLSTLEKVTGLTVSTAASSSSNVQSQTNQTGGNNASTTVKTNQVSDNSASTNSATTNSASSQNSSSSNTTKSTTTQQPTVDQVRLQAGYQAFVNSCQSCHSLGTATQYEGSYSASQWSDIVAQMNSYAGGTISDTQDIIYYLSHQGGSN